MAYTEKNYKTKRELIADFKEGKEIRVFQPGPFPLRGPSVTLEGPHYPLPHKWYAAAIINENAIIIKVK